MIRSEETRLGDGRGRVEEAEETELAFEDVLTGFLEEEETKAARPH